jgi:hypothetical protein
MSVIITQAGFQKRATRGPSDLVNTPALDPQPFAYQQASYGTTVRAEDVSPFGAVFSRALIAITVAGAAAAGQPLKATAQELPDAPTAIVARVRDIVPAPVPRPAFVLAAPRDEPEAGNASLRRAIAAVLPNARGSFVQVPLGQPEPELGSGTFRRGQAGIVPNARGGFISAAPPEQPDTHGAGWLERRPFAQAPAVTVTASPALFGTTVRAEDVSPFGASVFKPPFAAAPVNARGSFFKVQLGQPEPEPGAAWVREPFSVTPAIVNAPGRFVSAAPPEHIDTQAPQRLRFTPVSAAPDGPRAKFYSVAPVEQPEQPGADLRPSFQEPTFGDSVVVYDPGQEYHEPAQPLFKRAPISVAPVNARGEFLLAALPQPEPEAGSGSYREPFSVSVPPINARGTFLQVPLGQPEPEAGSAAFKRPFSVTQAPLAIAPKFSATQAEQTELGAAWIKKFASYVVAPLPQRTRVGAPPEQPEHGYVAIQRPTLRPPVALNLPQRTKLAGMPQDQLEPIEPTVNGYAQFLAAVVVIVGGGHRNTAITSTTQRGNAQQALRGSNAARNKRRG